MHQYDTWLRTLGTDMNNDDVITVANDGGSATEFPTVEGCDGAFITITGNTTFSITLLGVNGYLLSDFYG